MTDNLASILSLFAQNERRIGQLYKIYSRHFPDYRIFWERICAEEMEHVRLLEKVKALSPKNRKIIKESYYSRDIIKYIGDFISKEIERVKNKKIASKDAFSIALRLEKSMIEKKSFEMFTPTHPLIRKIFRRLNQDVKKHARLLEKELRKNNYPKV